MVALTIASMYLRSKTHYILFKGLASAGFTAAAAVSALCHDRSLFIVMPFFILCFAGDILLALSDEIDIRLRDPQFTSGVAAFAVAHVFLIYEFGRMTCWHISPLWVVFSAGLLLYTIYTCLLYTSPSAVSPSGPLPDSTRRNILRIHNPYTPSPYL